MAELVVYGIVLGSIIALGSVGLTLIWGITDLFNCAHGDQITVGAYIALPFVSLFSWIGFLQAKVGPFSFNWGLALAFIPAILLSIGLAVLIDRWVYKPLRQSGAHFITSFIASIGVAWGLRGLIYIIWGADFRFYTKGLRPMLFLPLEIKLRLDEIFIVVVAWAAVATVYLFLSKAKMGKALRALADNRGLARVAGINTERMIVWAWGIAAALIAIAGILYGIETQLRPEMGWIFLLPLFAAIILGGKGSITGALAGGLVLGIAQQVSTAWLLPTYKPAVAFIIMILVLLFRPKGIFGRRQM
ncbi:MAG: branched-chain amino acid ABC transporter permease [Desulfobacterales bacterium]|nr:branched-chain amino acid ABC transporter permease [Desulfobacterales bacterium]